VAGSFCGWRADGASLKPGSGGLYRSEPVSVPVGVRIDFKVTRGSWNNVEKVSDGGELPNRTFTPTQSISGRLVVSAQVVRWSDSQQLQKRGLNKGDSRESQRQDRQIRVFISSTFRDMQEEREELVKQIFPQLRRLCESRGVTWGEVDLRLGVPDEAKAEGKVLPLCLAEIERCRPYFIGLLGERYGWVPEEIPEDLIEAQPWLTKHRKDSVTALEILHGVLLNAKMAGHAFFYFRDPAYAASHAGFAEDDPARRDRLAALKNDIRKSGFPIAENFATPKQLGEWVLRDLTALIEEIYPESTIPDPLDRAAADHEAYAASRRRIYIGRQEYIERLDVHAAGDAAPLVVLGESGGGKSALLANRTHRWSEQHPETPVIVHFIGAAPDSGLDGYAAPTAGRVPAPVQYSDRNPGPARRPPYGLRQHTADGGRARAPCTGAGRPEPDRRPRWCTGPGLAAASHPGQYAPDCLHALRSPPG